MRARLTPEVIPLLIEWQPFKSEYDHWDRYAELACASGLCITLWNHSQRDRWMIRTGPHHNDTKPLDNFRPGDRRCTFEECCAEIARLMELNDAAR